MGNMGAHNESKLVTADKVETSCKPTGAGNMHTAG
jgi:hypothetical protein